MQPEMMFGHGSGGEPPEFAPLERIAERAPRAQEEPSQWLHWADPFRTVVEQAHEEESRDCC